MVLDHEYLLQLINKIQCRLNSGISTNDFIDSVTAPIMIEAAVIGTMCMHGHLRLESKGITLQIRQLNVFI